MKKNQNQNISSFQPILISSWGGKGHEPSCKSFSSNYGSSKLGSDSSLVIINKSDKIVVGAGDFGAKSSSIINYSIRIFLF